MQNKYYVYIMTNKSNDVLYVGVTNNISRRKWEHETHIKKGFSSKYKLEKCIYIEECNDVNDAIRREKQIKHWNRCKKFALISTINPELNELMTLDK